MIRAFAVIAMSAALGLLATSSATASDHRHGRGFVMPCSLDGINPVFHSVSSATLPLPGPMVLSVLQMARGSCTRIASVIERSIG